MLRSDLSGNFANIDCTSRGERYRADESQPVEPVPVLMITPELQNSLEGSLLSTSRTERVLVAGLLSATKASLRAWNCSV